MNLSIIKPTIESAAAIANICSSGWKQTVEGKLSEDYQHANIAYWYNQKRITSNIENGFYTHVALLDSKVVEVIGGGITNSATGEVFVLYVDENYRYKGIGRKLLQALTQEQKDKGTTEQWISVQEDNQRGIPLYEARGFLYKEKRTILTDTSEQQLSIRYAR